MKYLLLSLVLILLGTGCGDDRATGTDSGNLGDAGPGTDSALTDTAITPARPGEVDTSYGEGGYLALSGSLYGTGTRTSQMLVVANSEAILLSGDDVTRIEGINRRSRTVLPIGADGWLLASETSRGISVARYDSAFAFDESFAPDDALSSAVLDVAGDSIYSVLGVVGSAGQFTIGRFSAGGAADEGFIGGVADPADIDLDAEFIRVAADGSVFVVGDVRFTPFVTRFSADGTWDESFGEGGVLALSQFGPRNVRDAVIDPEGRILVLGMSSDTTQVMRVLSDGTVDASFGTAGLAEATFTRPLSSRYDEFVEVRTLALQPDGKIVVGGWYRLDEGEDDVFEEETALAIRLTSAGQPDPEFGSEGVARFEMAPGAEKSVIDRYSGFAFVGGRMLVSGEADGVAAVVALQM